MHKHNHRKLTLNRETLSRIDGESTKRVGGAVDSTRISNDYTYCLSDWCGIEGPSYINCPATIVCGWTANCVAR